MPRKTNQFVSQNEKIKMSRDILYWHLLWLKFVKTKQKLAYLSWQFEKIIPNYMDYTQRETVFFFFGLGLISLLFSLFKI